MYFLLMLLHRESSNFLDSAAICTHKYF